MISISENIPQMPTPFVAFSGRRAKYLSASARRPGEFTGNVGGGGCTASEARGYATVSRNAVRAAAVVKATAYIQQVAGGEKRRVRRSMARAKAKFILIETR